MLKNWKTSSPSWIRKNRSGYKRRYILSVHWRYLNLKNFLFLFIGRFDLNYPEFKCSECEGVMIAAENDFISSGWWPGSPKNMNYLFSADLLIMWNHLVHKTPGTSERKFIETLCEISKRSGRSGTICRQTFAISNKYYQYMEYLVEVEAKLRELFTCKAFGRRPLAMHIDDIMKLYRWLSSKGLEMQEFLYDFILGSKFKFLSGWIILNY